MRLNQHHSSHGTIRGGKRRTGCYLQLSESVVALLLARGLLSAHGDELVDAVCNGPGNTNTHVQQNNTTRMKTQRAENVSHRAAAASWFFRLGELGSVERALAASISLLDDMEIVLRLDTTCV